MATRNPDSSSALPPPQYVACIEIADEALRLQLVRIETSGGVRRVEPIRLTKKPKDDAESDSIESEEEKDSSDQRDDPSGVQDESDEEQTLAESLEAEGIAEWQEKTENKAQEATGRITRTQTKASVSSEAARGQTAEPRDSNWGEARISSCRSTSTAAVLKGGRIMFLGTETESRDWVSTKISEDGPTEKRTGNNFGTDQIPSTPKPDSAQKEKGYIILTDIIRGIFRALTSKRPPSHWARVVESYSGLRIRPSRLLYLIFERLALRLAEYLQERKIRARRIRIVIVAPVFSVPAERRSYLLQPIVSAVQGVFDRYGNESSSPGSGRRRVGSICTNSRIHTLSYDAVVVPSSSVLATASALSIIKAQKGQTNQPHHSRIFSISQIGRLFAYHVPIIIHYKPRRMVELALPPQVSLAGLGTDAEIFANEFMCLAGVNSCSVHMPSIPTAAASSRPSLKQNRTRFLEPDRPGMAGAVGGIGGGGGEARLRHRDNIHADELAGISNKCINPQKPFIFPCVDGLGPLNGQSMNFTFTPLTPSRVVIPIGAQEGAHGSVKGKGVVRRPTSLPQPSPGISAYDKVLNSDRLRRALRDTYMARASTDLLPELKAAGYAPRYLRRNSLSLGMTRELHAALLTSDANFERLTSRLRYTVEMKAIARNIENADEGGGVHDATVGAIAVPLEFFERATKYRTDSFVEKMNQALRVLVDKKGKHGPLESAKITAVAFGLGTKWGVSTSNRKHISRDPLLAEWVEVVSPETIGLECGDLMGPGGGGDGNEEECGKPGESTVLAAALLGLANGPGDSLALTHALRKISSSSALAQILAGRSGAGGTSSLDQSLPKPNRPSSSSTWQQLLYSMLGSVTHNKRGNLCMGNLSLLSPTSLDSRGPSSAAKTPALSESLPSSMSNSCLEKSMILPLLSSSVFLIPLSTNSRLHWETRWGFRLGGDVIVSTLSLSAASNPLFTLRSPSATADEKARKTSRVKKESVPIFRSDTSIPGAGSTVLLVQGYHGDPVILSSGNPRVPLRILEGGEHPIMPKLGSTNASSGVDVCDRTYSNGTRHSNPSMASGVNTRFQIPQGQSVYTNHNGISAPETHTKFGSSEDRSCNGSKGTVDKVSVTNQPSFCWAAKGDSLETIRARYGIPKEGLLEMLKENKSLFRCESDIYVPTETLEKMKIQYIGEYNGKQSKEKEDRKNAGCFESASKDEEKKGRAGEKCGVEHMSSDSHLGTESAAFYAGDVALQWEPIPEHMVLPPLTRVKLVSGARLPGGERSVGLQQVRIEAEISILPGEYVPSLSVEFEFMNGDKEYRRYSLPLAFCLLPRCSPSQRHERKDVVAAWDPIDFTKGWIAAARAMEEFEALYTSPHTKCNYTTTSQIIFSAELEEQTRIKYQESHKRKRYTGDDVGSSITPELAGAANGSAKLKQCPKREGGRHSDQNKRTRITGTIASAPLPSGAPPVSNAKTKLPPWSKRGSRYIGEKGFLYYDNKPVLITVEKWCPNAIPPLWHVVHQDGDEEDLIERELVEALEVYKIHTSLKVGQKVRFCNLKSWKIGVIVRISTKDHFFKIKQIQNYKKTFVSWPKRDVYVDARNIKIIDGPEGAPPDPEQMRLAKLKKEKERQESKIRRMQMKQRETRTLRSGKQVAHRDPNTKVSNKKRRGLRSSRRGSNKHSSSKQLVQRIPVVYVERIRSFRAEWFEGAHKYSKLFDISSLGKEATKAHAEAFVDKMCRREEDRIIRAQGDLKLAIATKAENREEQGGSQKEKLIPTRRSKRSSTPKANDNPRTKRPRVEVAVFKRMRRRPRAISKVHASSHRKTRNSLRSKKEFQDSKRKSSRLKGYKPKNPSPAALLKGRRTRRRKQNGGGIDGAGDSSPVDSDPEDLSGGRQIILKLQKKVQTMLEDKSQTDCARLVGTTQTAISNFLRHPEKFTLNSKSIIALRNYFKGSNLD